MKTFKQFFNESTKEKPVKKIINGYDGTIEEWRLSNYQKHREDGPATIEYDKNGNITREVWLINDKIHREDGPAIIWYDENGIASEHWWLNFKPVTKEEVMKRFPQNFRKSQMMDELI